MEHVECCHPENGVSPFNVREDEGISRLAGGHDEEAAGVSDAPSQGDDYFQCDCGEVVMLPEFNSHMALHESEETTVDEAAPAAILDHGRSLKKENLARASMADIGTYPSKSSSSKSHVKHRSRASKDNSHHGVKDFVGVLLGSNSSPSRPKAVRAKHKAPRRLGKAELGPHADEDQMPGWLRKQLTAGPPVTVMNKIDYNGNLVRVESMANEIRGTMAVLNQLCEQDRTLSKVYLSHPDVRHVVKMSKEGGFCGYRNIQMMISFIQDAKSQGYQHFSGKLPSILELQDAIERAWDKGINDAGRIETGGIRGTRKYIGTPEAQALFVSLDISCEANAFGDTNDSPVFRQLIETVEEYFLSGATDPSQKVCRTSLPPLYFQHPGHSLTIVGLEKHKSGSSNFLVLDPMFRPSPAINNLIDVQFSTPFPEKLLKAYRRGETYLSKYRNFELLKLTWRVPAKEGWT
ncbi:hypothetical protein MMC22_000075 [Lobaria immixta]|nr:hypothetical protein [Lobaria immixta]